MTCSLEMSTNERVSASPFGGSEQGTDLLQDRWVMAVEMPPADPEEAGRREAFLDRFRGLSNWVALYHFARQQPLGTARGTMVLNATAAQGAANIVISGVTPSTGTLIPGDMLGCGGLLLRVADDCVASAGVITVPIVNRLRYALPSGTSVVWYRPTAMFRLLSRGVVQYGAGVASSTSLEFGEAISI
ncbi:MAG: hypothetical protein V4757_07095 [Pseudomonadota bacterium]